MIEKALTGRESEHRENPAVRQPLAETVLYEIRIIGCRCDLCHKVIRYPYRRGLPGQAAEIIALVSGVLA